MFWGWRTQTKTWDLGDGKHIVCVYRYFHIWFILRFITTKKWYLQGNIRSEDRRLTVDQVHDLAPNLNIRVSAYGSTGEKVQARLIPNHKSQRVSNEKLVGHVGVDTGQVIIVDPGNLGEFRYDLDDYAKGIQKNDKGNFSYSGACELTEKGERAGQLKENGIEAVASGSGYGDGDYPVYATFNDEGRVVSLRIDFMAEDE
jgi:hypothetical protein